MGNKIFDPALSQLAPGPWSHFGPISFQQYLATAGLPPKATAPAISVDALERLPAELKAQSTMVLRLGTAPDGRTTQFTLVRSTGRLHDFFLLDEPIFRDVSPQLFRPTADPTALLPYHIFPKPTEPTLVHLAFASGLIGAALQLDTPYPTSAPAMGSSTYPFSFLIHTDYPVTVHHAKGQVEIDAVFVGHRGGRPHLFVLESKATSEKSLAKHKLVYPLLALAPYTPADLPMIPVYMRVHYTPGRALYQIVECAFPDSRQQTVALNQLSPVRAGRWTINLPRANPRTT